MNKTESISELANALAKFNGKMITLVKDSKNPQFRNSGYLSLGHLINETRPILQEFGLSILQFPLSKENGDIGIQSMVLHESGQFIQTEPIYITPMKLLKGGGYEEWKDAQGAGSAISYLRRYSYQALLNIAAEDDDGNKASGYNNSNNSNSNSNSNSNNTNNNSSNKNNEETQKLSDKQISRLWGIAKGKNIPNDTVFKMIKAHGVNDVKLLNKQQYDEICGRLETGMVPITQEQLDSIKTLMSLKNVNKATMQGIVKDLFGTVKISQDLTYEEAIQLINNLMTLPDNKTA